MHTGKLVFAQLMDHLPLHTFRRCVAKYPGRYPTLTFAHLDQLLCMAFAQLIYRESHREGGNACATPRPACARTPPSSTIWEFAVALPAALWRMPTKTEIGASIRISHSA